MKDRQRTENRQTDRESNYRRHSNRRWMVGLSGPIIMVFGLAKTSLAIEASYNISKNETFI